MLLSKSLFPPFPFPMDFILALLISQAIAMHEHGTGPFAKQALGVLSQCVPSGLLSGRVPGICLREWPAYSKLSYSSGIPGMQHRGTEGFLKYCSWQ